MRLRAYARSMLIRLLGRNVASTGNRPSLRLVPEYAHRTKLGLWRDVFKACFGASLVCNTGPHLSDMGIVDTENDVTLKDPTVDK